MTCAEQTWNWRVWTESRGEDSKEGITRTMDRCGGLEFGRRVEQK